MRTRPLTVVVSGAGPGPAHKQLTAAIHAAWPGTPAGPEHGPEVAYATLFEVLANVAGGDDEAPAPATGGSWLIVLDGDEPGHVLWQLIDVAERRLMPAIILLPEVTARQQALQRGGVLLQRRDAEPALLAAMLYTLSQRQETVEHLGRELFMARASQGGLRGEMDRIHEELALAARVQHEFLPKQLPQLAGLDVAVLYRPAQYVSGDFYSVEVVDDSRIAFFIADAVGHGVPAALLTMVIARALGSREWGPGGWRTLEPSEVLARLNTLLCEHQHGTNRFATAIYGVIDSITGQVTLAGAGHPPPLVVSGNAVRKIETEGPLLGVFHDATFDQVTFGLNDGQRLLLYTDGFEVAFPEPDARGRKLRVPTTNYLARLLRVGEDRPDGPDYDLTERMRALEAALDEQAGSLHQADDVTALAIASRIPSAVRKAA